MVAASLAPAGTIVSWALRFRPRLVDALQGYTGARFASDAAAGVTVGVLALPLAIAFAIASGMKPEAGIYTAIIAGFIISALGGSRVQIGGPTGAFIVIVYGIVTQYGVANLLICTMMAGAMLLAMGLARMGTWIRFIPVSVVSGFTKGIAVLIHQGHRGADTVVAGEGVFRSGHGGAAG